MKTTIKDIAQALGISPKTVSKALNDRGEVSKSLQEKIVRTAQQMIHMRCNNDDLQFLPQFEQKRKQAHGICSSGNRCDYGIPRRQHSLFRNQRRYFILHGG